MATSQQSLTSLLLKPGEEDNNKRRQPPQRTSARVRSRIAKPGESETNGSESRRLALEYTYIQGDENRLCGLLEDLRSARAVSVCSGASYQSLEESLSAPVLGRAKELNRIRFQRGDDHDRLTVSIQTIQSNRVTNVRNPDWNAQGDLHFSPITAMAAAARCNKQIVGALPVQMWMPNLGRTIEMRRILDACTSYRGSPCSILSPSARPPGCGMLSDHFDKLNICRVQLMRQVAQAQGEESIRMEARLATLHNEHSVLASLAFFANARLIGPWNHEWQPPFQFSPRILKIVESLNLTLAQRWQLFSMRERCKDIILTAKSAHTCSMDIATELARRTSPSALFNTQDTITFLDIIEAAEQAKFMIPATEFMASQASLSNILSPLQSARLVIACRMMYMENPNIKYETVDFVRFIAACFLDEELGAWLNDAQPA